MNETKYKLFGSRILDEHLTLQRGNLAKGRKQHIAPGSLVGGKDPKSLTQSINRMALVKA